MYTVLSCIECHHAKSCTMYFVPSCIQFPGCVQLYSAFCTRTIMRFVKSCIWFHHVREMRHLHPTSTSLATAADCITVLPCIQAEPQVHYAFFPKITGSKAQRKEPGPWLSNTFAPQQNRATLLHQWSSELYCAFALQQHWDPHLHYISTELHICTTESPTCTLHNCIFAP